MNGASGQHERPAKPSDQPEMGLEHTTDGFLTHIMMFSLVSLRFSDIPVLATAPSVLRGPSVADYVLKMTKNHLSGCLLQKDLDESITAVLCHHQRN